MGQDLDKDAMIFSCLHVFLVTGQIHAPLHFLCPCKLKSLPFWILTKRCTLWLGGASLFRDDIRSSASCKKQNNTHVLGHTSTHKCSDTGAESAVEELNNMHSRRATEGLIIVKAVILVVVDS